jgi:hypothetical protein
LGQLGRDLDATVRMLKDADLAAALLRHDADLAESRAFLAATGSVDARKHEACLATEKVEREALEAEAGVRYLRARVKAIELRTEIGRSVNAVLRTEMQLLPSQEG